MKQTLPDEDYRPHWVRALDQNFVHASRPENWNRQVASSSTTPNNSTLNPKHKHNNNHSVADAQKKQGGHKQKSLTNADLKNRERRGKYDGRKHGENFMDKTYPSVLSRGHSSDSSSLVSGRTTSSTRRDRKQSRRLGLFFILLITAFIVAALLGWLIYFLLMKVLQHTKLRTLWLVNCSGQTKNWTLFACLVLA
ncbi:hypothetical protein PoB_000069100 [Plakobranchus ocellatus]|uniref:Uncharacterized protein n=1 Tax=Plakobranchus ocellatus TaxID=259542 RepID=A0AAV3XVV5_9GAST|nr:hypothetical protein PoB_000069100 [Plakobranchus ocellatus]